MTRVLFVTHTPEFGGAEKHLLDLVRRMDAVARCTILCFSEDFYSEALRGRSNVQVCKVPQITRAKLWSYWRVFRKYPADVIVLIKGIFEHYPLSAYVAARLSPARRLIALEQLIADPFPSLREGGGALAPLRRLLGWRARYLLTCRLKAYLCDVTVCVSDAVRQRLTQEYGYPNTSAITIHNGVDLRHYAVNGSVEAPLRGPRPDQIPPCLTLVCAARLSSVKRIDVLLDALAGVAQSPTRWRCLILGTGPLEAELRAQAQRLGLSERVVFVGFVSDVRPYLQAADLFVLSSEKEGLPLALLEAMAAGVPAVVTDVGGTSEVIVHGQNGLLVTAGSVQALECAIRHMLTHPDERRRMGVAARARVQQHFDIEKTMGRLAEVVLASRT